MCLQFISKATCTTVWESHLVYQRKHRIRAVWNPQFLARIARGHFRGGEPGQGLQPDTASATAPGLASWGHCPVTSSFLGCPFFVAGTGSQALFCRNLSVAPFLLFLASNCSNIPLLVHLFLVLFLRKMDHKIILLKLLMELGNTFCFVFSVTFKAKKKKFDWRGWNCGNGLKALTVLSGFEPLLWVMLAVRRVGDNQCSQEGLCLFLRASMPAHQRCL